MKQHFCLDCHYMWHSVSDQNECPECGCNDIDIEEEPIDFDDGFFEGDIVSFDRE